MIKTSESEYIGIKKPTAVELTFREYRLRKLGVRGVYANAGRILRIVTEEDLIEVNISSYDETRGELDIELSSSIEQAWIIGKILDYFDEKWSEIEEFVSDKATVEGGKVE
jgi:hypothetical protein